MKWVRMGAVLVVALAALAGGLWWYAARADSYQTTGVIRLPGLKAPVTVRRDEKGMAYIEAGSFEDALFAQGFVSAQDRLFGMQLSRFLAQGRISELAGEKGLASDIRMRTLGLHRLARRHAGILSAPTRALYQRYVDGINAFIDHRPGELSLAFKLSGLPVEHWELADCLSILYLMGWNTSANFDTEIVAQLLVEALGPDQAREIFPLNINPDDPADNPGPIPAPGKISRLGLTPGQALALLGPDSPPFPSPALGSNNWVVGPQFTGGGKPILAGDTHLDARMLPGVWYPCGLAFPGVRAVGVGIPGLPGLVLGRNQYVAVAITNSYGDSQDLCVETPDPANPDNYLEGPESVPFTVVAEDIRIRDSKAEGGYRTQQLKVRHTRRGPVVSDFVPPPGSPKLLTLRWSPAESMGPELGLARLMTSRSAQELKDAIKDLTAVMLNFVFADQTGNIGWQTSGRLPIRASGDGALPQVVQDGKDPWTGWIPYGEMPGSMNPPRGWLGTCNHKTVTSEYPYYYSSYFAASFRYARLKELLGRPGRFDALDHWGYQRDEQNLWAARLAPRMAQALADFPATRRLGGILAAWDHRDVKGSPAPLVFQAVMVEFARQVFVDELGDDLTLAMLKKWYFWQERLTRMVEEGGSPWFDDRTTPDKTETMDDIFRRAAETAQGELSGRYGSNPDAWRWGDAHLLVLMNPLRREGLGRDLLGTGPLPMGGSGETLYRGGYNYDKPFEARNFAALRMVVDLADGEKVMAVLPGGVTERLFSPHQTDQAASYMDGRQLYWWYSPEAVAAHTEDTVSLEPGGQSPAPGS